MRSTLLLASFSLLVACSSSSSPPSGTQDSGSPGGDTGNPGTDTGGSADPTVLATNLTNPVALAVDANNVYFACNDNENQGGGGIFSVPIAGGTPKKLADEQVPDWLDIDDGFVYWVTGIGGNPVFKRIAKDGSGSPQSLSDSSLSTVGSPDASDAAFQIYQGKIYFVGGDTSSGGGVGTLSTSGGSLSWVVPIDVAGDVLPSEFIAVDSTGIYYTQVEPTDLNHTKVMKAGLDGGGIGTFVVRDTVNDFAGYRLLGGTLYWVQQAGSGSSTSELHDAPGGTDTKLATFQFPGANYVTASSGDVFVSIDQGGNSGIYRVASDGTSTRVHADDNLQPGNEGTPRVLVSDATRLYWVSGGFIGFQAEIHAMAR